MKDKLSPWIKKHFSEREQKEIDFCKTYASYYAHGTNGHNTMMIVAKLSQLLDSIHYIVDDKGRIGGDNQKFKMIMGYTDESDEL